MADLGSDFLGVLDIDADFSVGDGKLALAHAIARRLTTTPGQMLDDPAYGYNVFLLVNAAVNAGAVANKIREQILLEERVTEQTRVTVSQVGSGPSASLTIEIALATDDTATSYPLTLVLVDGKLTVSDGSTFTAEYLLQVA